MKIKITVSDNVGGQIFYTTRRESYLDRDNTAKLIEELLNKLVKI